MAGKGGIAAMVCAGALIMGGCLINSNNSESFTGKRVSNATYNQIEPGVTTKQWIIGTLGEPTERTTLENGEEIWKWSYTQTKSSRGSLLFVFGGTTTKTDAGSAYVQFRDNMVVKTWRTDG
jgi:outer membrane protein assembly factor BamE (lipoprotein component of BamABCDE complex)